ncbi:MAG TPA: STAS domain-containing protein [Acidimicrobiia bacterium]|nr:STAS domain-containing protein [Acidimicrobiia bacterium]
MDADDLIDAPTTLPRSRPQLQIEVGEHDTYATLVAVGCLDISTSEALRGSLIALVDAGYRHVVVDLEEVTFGDCTGLGVLVAGRRRLLLQGGEIHLVCTEPGVLRLFEISGR